MIFHLLFMLHGRCTVMMQRQKALLTPTIFLRSPETQENNSGFIPTILFLYAITCQSIQQSVE